MQDRSDEQLIESKRRHLEWTAKNRLREMRGKVLVVHSIDGLVCGNNRMLHGLFVVRVRGEQPPELTCRWIGDWLDPLWDVKVLAGPVDSFILRNTSVYGDSYNVKTDEIDPLVCFPEPLWHKFYRWLMRAVTPAPPCLLQGPKYDQK